jgi:outer membrane protein
MKRIAAIAVLAFIFLLPSRYLSAQTKIGYISFNELLSSMPEFKKADTTLAVFRSTLEQQFDAYQKEYSDQQGILNSKDTSKFTQIQLGVKRQNLLDMLSKIQGYNQQASQLLEQKRQEILAPIQKKADNAIQVVAKENGYVYILEKETLHTFPLSDDILPLVKKKLGIK